MGASAVSTDMRVCASWISTLSVFVEVPASVDEKPALTLGLIEAGGTGGTKTLGGWGEDLVSS